MPKIETIVRAWRTKRGDDSFGSPEHRNLSEDKYNQYLNLRGLNHHLYIDI